jgi:3-isopropylmalate/(R)-2-methylmalate dehydratase small subunit
MPLEKIAKIEGKGVYVTGNDIDTDRVIPARFMKCVTFDGLGEYLFYDVRFNKDGSSKGHPLDNPKHKGATILLSGANFGCGSSREHAPQALQKFGMRAVIAESFAEIFAGNCTSLGIPCIELSGPEIA